MVIGFRTGLARRPVPLSVCFLLALVGSGWFSLSSAVMSWKVTFFFGAGFAGGAVSWTGFSAGCSFAAGFAVFVVRVVRAAGFSLAAELAVVAVARVDLVARFGFSSNLSLGISTSGAASSTAVSAFFGRPLGLGAVALVALDLGSALCSGSGSATTVFPRFARVVGFESSCGFAGFLTSSFSSGVTLSRLRGAAESGAAGAADAVARVRTILITVVVRSSFVA